MDGRGVEPQGNITPRETGPTSTCWVVTGKSLEPQQEENAMGRAFNDVCSLRLTKAMGPPVSTVKVDGEYPAAGSHTDIWGL